jgi:hypothetical protein
MGIIQLLAKRLLICYKGCETAAAVVEQYARAVAMLKKCLGCGTDHPIYIGQRT